MILAATGHRPDKLGGYDSPKVDAALHKLALSYLEAAAPEKVISGMAQGWDTAWAEAAIQLGIPLLAAVPFAGQALRWPTAAQSRYLKILDRAAESIIVSPGTYETWKMQARNRWMVNHCDTLVALWNGDVGGTGNCVEYAQQNRTPIVNLWKRWVDATIKGADK